MADKKNINPNEVEGKLKDLKIELLKQPTKRKQIKREIARLLTFKNKSKENNKK